MSRALTFACLVILADLAASFENVNMWECVNVEMLKCVHFKKCECVNVVVCGVVAMYVDDEWFSHVGWSVSIGE